MTEQAIERQLAAGTWHLDPATTSATFSVQHFGHTVKGTIPVRKAIAEIGPDGDIRGAHIELDLAAIATGNDRRNGDLAKPRFLDTARYPTVVVDIPPAVRDGNCWHATAMLTVRGVDVPVDLAIDLTEPGTDEAVQVIVTGTLDRTPIGMKVPRFIIARTIDIRVDATFRWAAA